MATFVSGIVNKVTGKEDEDKKKQQQQQQQQQQRGPMGMPMPAAPAIPPHNPNWSTRLGQCDPPALCEEWMMGLFCFHCGAASAKSQADGTNVCYDCLCYHHIGALSWHRRDYDLKGTCGDDLMCGLFCFPCLVRRALTEGRLRGPAMTQRALNPQVSDWQETLFGCDCCQFFEALLCPFCVSHYTRNMLQPHEQGDCCFDMLCIIPTSTYGQVRHTYNIQAEFDVFEDVCLPVVCYPCALSQANREAVRRSTQAFQMNHPYGNRNRQGGKNGRAGCCCC